MTDTQDLSHLRALAAEWLDRGCDADDLRCEGGSTSVNKLLRAYVAATEPTKVIALLDKLEASQAELEEWRFTNRIDELQRAHDQALARLAAAEARMACNTKVLQEMHDEDIKEINKLKLHIKHIGNDALRTDNAELRARLAELEKQEPVGEMRNDAPYFFNGMYTDKPDLPNGTNLYAAAGASPVQPSQAPETWTDDGGWEFPIAQPAEQPSQALTPYGMSVAVMDLAEMLGNDPETAKLIDHKAWNHLLTYAPSQAGELTDAEIDRVAHNAGIHAEPRFGFVSNGNVQMRHFAKAIIAAINAKGVK